MFELVGGIKRLGILLQIGIINCSNCSRTQQLRAINSQIYMAHVRSDTVTDEKNDINNVKLTAT